jgi:hypothetical protein
MDLMKVNVHSISLMAKALLLIKIQVTTNNSMVIGLLASFMMALLFTRTEIHLQDCSEMAEDIMGR